MFRHSDVFGPNGIHTLSSPPSSRLECFHCRVSRTGQQSQISNRQNQTQTVKFSFWCVGGYWNNPGELVHAQKRKKNTALNCNTVMQYHNIIAALLGFDWFLCIFCYYYFLSLFTFTVCWLLLLQISKVFLFFSQLFHSCWCCSSHFVTDQYIGTLWQITEWARN